MNRTRAARLWLGLALAAGALLGCDEIGKTIDKVRMKVVGITVKDPTPGSAEWVLNEVIQAGATADEEAGWERFQKILHSDERNAVALMGWHQHGWPRIRKQARDYLAEDGSFTIVDFKEMMSSTGQAVGYEFYVRSKKKEMPTPCAVYIDDQVDGAWRVRRCSL
jgi:hypothetical protein